MKTKTVCTICAGMLMLSLAACEMGADHIVMPDNAVAAEEQKLDDTAEEQKLQEVHESTAEEKKPQEALDSMAENITSESTDVQDSTGEQTDEAVTFHAPKKEEANHKLKEQENLYENLDKVYKLSLEMPHIIDENRPFNADGKVLFLMSAYVNSRYTPYVCIYDISSKETKKVRFPISDMDEVYYYRDNLYFWRFKKFVKMDTDGNELASCSINIGAYGSTVTVLQNEYVLLSTIEKRYRLLSPELETVADFDNIPLPKIKKDDGSAGTEDVRFLISDSTERLYCIGEITGNLFYLDLENPTKYIPYDIGADTESNPKYGYLIGDYLISSVLTCNVATGEVWDINEGSPSDEIGKTMYSIFAYDGDITKDFRKYYGGNYHIKFDSDKKCWEKCTYCADLPSGNNLSKGYGYKSDQLGMDKNGSNIKCVDDTYYIIRNKTGCYLRTYEKGSKEEEPMYLFK